MDELVFAITVGSIILINIIIAFIRKKGERRTFLQYAADPNKNRYSIIATTLTGTIVGGGMFLAVGQMGYESKYVGIALGIIYIIGLGLVGLFTKKIRQLMEQQKCHTLLDFIGLNYDKKVITQFTLVNFFMYLFLLASQFVAMSQLLSFIETKMVYNFIPYILLGMAIIALFLYPIIGGIRKDIQTDIIQMVVIFIAAILIVYQLINKNVVSEVFNSNHFSLPLKNNYGLVFIIGSILFLTPSFFVRMDMWQRINTAKTSKDAKYGFWIAGILSFVFFILFTLIGSYANILKFEDSQFASLNTIYSLFENPIVLGFIIGAFFAAVLSSADTLINNVSIFTTKLVFPKSNFSIEDFSSSKLLKFSRINAVLLTFVAIAISFLIPDIVDLLIGAFSLLLIFFPTIMGLLFKHNNSDAAFYSAFLGLIGFLCCFFFWNPKLAFVPAVLISFAVYFPYYFITKKRTLEI